MFNNIMKTRQELVETKIKLETVTHQMYYLKREAETALAYDESKGLDRYFLKNILMELEAFLKD